MRAVIYHVEQRGDGWFAFGVPAGRPRLRCTWVVDEAVGGELKERLRNSPGSIEAVLGAPERTMGVPERFEVTQGY